MDVDGAEASLQDEEVPTCTTCLSHTLKKELNLSHQILPLKHLRLYCRRDITVISQVSRFELSLFLAMTTLT